MIAPAQLSVAKGAVGVALHSSVTSVNEVTSATGAVASTTTISKEHVAVLPLPSVASKVLVVVPTGNVEPLANPAI